MSTSPVADVVRLDGTTESLGAFLTRSLKSSGSVVDISKRSGLSRSFLYVLMDDQQVPSTESLVTLLEAIGCEDVRPADPGEPGDLAFRWRGQEAWVRFPTSSRRTARSRKTMQSFSRWNDSAPTSSAPLMSEPMMSVGSSYDASDDWGRSPAGERQLLLGQLLESAGSLDEDRLRILVDHARLLRRG